MLVTITEFAESRNADRDTVNAYIRKHPEIQQHVSRQGKNTVIDTDSDGFKALEKQYPLPQMVQIIEDTESRKELIQAQKLIIQLQNQLNEANMQIAQTEAIKLLLQDKESQLAKSEERLVKAEKKAEDAYAENKELREALESERSKSWIQKLFGK